MGVSFVDIFRIVGTDICAFFSLYELFNTVECLNTEIREICISCPERWRNFIEVYKIGQAKILESIQIDDGVVSSTNLCDDRGSDISEYNWSDSDISDTASPDLSLILCSDVQLLSLNNIPSEMLHLIIKNGIIPSSQMTGSHHTNPYHWELISSNYDSNRRIDPIRIKLSPFNKVKYCRGVCWFDCSATMRLITEGQFGVFWRVNFRHHRDHYVENRDWVLQLKATSIRKQGDQQDNVEKLSVVGQRRISMDEMRKFSSLNWCDVLVGTIDVRNKTKQFQSTNFVHLNEPVELEVLFINTSSTFNRSGHYFDFIYLYPLINRIPTQSSQSHCSSVINCTINGGLNTNFIRIS